MQNLVLKDHGEPVQKNDQSASPILSLSNHYTSCHYRSHIYQCLEQFHIDELSYKSSIPSDMNFGCQAFSYPITSPNSALGRERTEGALGCEPSLN